MAGIDRAGVAAETSVETLTALQKRKVDKAQSIIEGRIVIAEGDLRKVLKTSVVSTVTSVEVLDKLAVVSGKTHFHVIYVDEVGEYKTAELTADFNEKIACALLLAGQHAFCRAEVIDSDISGVSENEIKIASVTDISLTVLERQTSSFVTNTGGNVVALKKSQSVSSVSAFCRTSFMHEFEIETRNKIDRVLYAHYECLTKKTSFDNGVLRIEGEIEASIVYIMQGEEALFKSVCETVPFIEEVSVSGLESGGMLEVLTNVQSHTTNFKDTDFSASITAGVVVMQTRSVSVDTVVDAFSITNELNLSYESSSFMHLADSLHVQEKISSTAEVNIQNMTLNKVVGSSIKNLLMTSIFVQEDFVTVEGLANITVFTEVGVDGSDERMTSSVDVEIPFSVRNHAYGTVKDDKVSAELFLSDVVVRHKRTNEIDVSCILKINMFVYKHEEHVFVKEIAAGEIKAFETGAISFYITRPGDTPFRISKKFSMPIETICSFNADVENVLREEKEIPAGTQIVVYRRKCV